MGHPENPYRSEEEGEVDGMGTEVGVEEGKFSREALFAALGAATGLTLGVLAWAIGSGNLDLGSLGIDPITVYLPGIKLPFSGEELGKVIGTFGQGN